LEKLVLVRICSVIGCKNKHKGRGYCDKHLQRLRNHGNVNYVPDPKIKSAKLSKLHTGRIVPTSVRKKISKTLTGVKHSAERRKKNSESNKGRKLTTEHKKNISKGGIGHIVSEATREKIGLKHKGKKMPDHVKEMLVKLSTGRKTTEETKKKQSISVRKAWANPELRRKQSKRIRSLYADGSLAKKLSEIQNRPEMLEANRKRNTGKITSEETKKKISDAHSTPEMKEAHRKRLRKTRKKFSSPNNPEKKIIKILNDAKIKHQFQVDVEYTDVEKGRVSKSLDFLLRPKRIIEHNGTYTHADPRKYKPDALIREHNKMIKASEIWKRERIMLRQIRKKGYKILVIWQLDLYNDTENTTKKILKFASKT